MNDSTRTASRPEDPAASQEPTLTYRARPRRREFVITSVDDVVHRESDFGLTLDEILADLASSHREMCRTDPGADDYVETFDDQVIWGEGNRVLAVVRLDASGDGLEVVRFDGPASAPPGVPIPAPPDDEDDDDDDEG
jgi:hypothetical protein